MPWWKCVALPLAAMLLQTAVLPGTAISAVRPDFVLLAVVAVAMLQPLRDRALICGALGGLMLDLTCGRFIGLNLMLFFAVAWAAHEIARSFMRPSIILSAAGAGAFSLVVGLSRAGVLMLSGVSLGGPGVLGIMLVTGAAYDSALMAAVHGAVMLKS